MSVELMSAQEKIKHHKDTAQKNHHVEMSKDMQTCRIECGCGCHQQLDSLPHLLSPHIVTQVQVLPEIKALKISNAYISNAFHYTIKVALPPPDLS